MTLPRLTIPQAEKIFLQLRNHGVGPLNTVLVWVPPGLTAAMLQEAYEVMTEPGAPWEHKNIVYYWVPNRPQRKRLGINPKQPDAVSATVQGFMIKALTWCKEQRRVELPDEVSDRLWTEAETEHERDEHWHQRLVGENGILMQLLAAAVERGLITADRRDELTTFYQANPAAGCTVGQAAVRGLVITMGRTEGIETMVNVGGGVFFRIE